MRDEHPVGGQADALAVTVDHADAVAVDVAQEAHGVGVPAVVLVQAGDHEVGERGAPRLVGPDLRQGDRGDRQGADHPAFHIGPAVTPVLLQPLRELLKPGHHRIPRTVRGTDRSSSPAEFRQTTAPRRSVTS